MNCPYLKWRFLQAFLEAKVAKNTTDQDNRTDYNQTEKRVLLPRFRNGETDGGGESRCRKQ